MFTWQAVAQWITTWNHVVDDGCTEVRITEGNKYSRVDWIGYISLEG